MSNAFRRFLDLIPAQAEFIGTVQTAQHPNYKVLVADGSGLVACTSSSTWIVGQRVFIQGQLIVRGAPDGPVIHIEI